MMPAKFNLYSAWIDPYFYVWALVFAAALFSLLYSIRRYLELKNASADEEEVSDEAAQELPPQEMPVAEQPLEDDIPDGEKTLVVPPPFQPELEESAPQEPAVYAQEEPEPAVEQPAGEPRDNNRAENFVRGIYEGISDLDERMKGIESALSKSRVNNDFTVKFLEDVLQDIETLDKEKLKGRIEYLLSDLKK